MYQFQSFVILWKFDDPCGIWWIHVDPLGDPLVSTPSPEPPTCSSDLQLRLRFFVRVQLQLDACSALLCEENMTRK